MLINDLVVTEDGLATLEYVCAPALDLACTMVLASEKEIFDVVFTD